MSNDNNLFFLPLHDMKTVSIVSERLSGQPCLKGHRIGLAQFLAEISERKNIDDFAEAYGISSELCRDILCELSVVIMKEYNANREQNKSD